MSREKNRKKNHKLNNDLKKDRRKALIASVFVFLFIVVLTVVALELPKMYYKKEDAKMVGQSAKYHYEQNEMHYAASQQQKINALSNSNLTTISTEKVSFTDEDLDVVKRELARCLDWGWGGFIRYILEDDKNTRIVSYGTTALWNDHDQVYTMDIRLLVFYNSDYLLSPAFIIYDDETGTIYGMNLDTYVAPTINLNYYANILGEDRWLQILDEMSYMNDVDYTVEYYEGNVVLSEYDYFILVESQDANAFFGHYYTEYKGLIPGECSIGTTYIYFFPGNGNGYIFQNNLVSQLEYTIYSAFEEVDFGYY